MSDQHDPLVVEPLGEVRGLEVFRQPAPPGSPSFSASYVGPAGWAYDPPQREGSALLMSQLLASGTRRLDRRALARTLDGMGATLARQCAPESNEVTIWGPADLWAKLLRLLAEVVLHPRPADADVLRVRRQLIERQLRELAEPSFRADREFHRTVFPSGHPYRSTGTGSERSLRRTDRRSLLRFHAEHFTPEGGQLVLTGGAGPRELLAVVRSAFRDWPRTVAPPKPRAAPTRATAVAPVSVALPGTTQVEIRLGGASVARSDPDYPAALLANEVLGGRPLLSRLFQQVRERSGLAYHASSELQSMRWGGFWVAQAGTGADRWPSVVREMEAELERIRTELVPGDELDRIRKSAVGEIPLALETTAGAHELAVDVAYHHLPPDFYRAWPGTLAAVTAADVRRAAQTALGPRTAATVLAGPLPSGRSLEAASASGHRVE